MSKPSSFNAGYYRQLSLMVAPYLVGTLILVVLPAVATFFVAFTDYNFVTTPRWVGIDNFRRALASSYVQKGLVNSAIFLILAVPVRTLGALFLALLLNVRRRGFGFYRAAVYLPTIVPPVAYALIWLWIFNPLYGPLNLALGRAGITGPAWLLEPNSARIAIVIVLAFQLGEGFVVLLAGRQSLSPAIYEAARVDGAGTWAIFWHITLPLLMPWLLLLTVRDLLVSLQETFTPAFVLTYGGPYYATTFAPLLIYEIAFDYDDFGMATALMVWLYVLMGLCAAGIVWLIRRVNLPAWPIEEEI